jgi:hypothetical protein
MRSGVGFAQNVKEIVWNWLVDNVVEHLPKFDADCLLSQPGFFHVGLTWLSPIIPTKLLGHAGSAMLRPAPTSSRADGARISGCKRNLRPLVP